MAGTCATPVPTCNDGIRNQDETGVDCGGVCPACAAPSCTDGIQNQDETDVDCGGVCPACDTCFTAGSTFGHTALDTQTASFSITIQVTPNSGNVDGVIGLARNAPNAYSALATIGRFNDAGRVDARNGGAYQADTVFNHANQEYTVTFDVDMAGTFDVTVDGVKIADDYAFRTEQQGISEINYLGYVDMFGSTRICDIQVGCVSLSDLMDIIQHWKSGARNINDVMSSIRAWKRGC